MTCQLSGRFLFGKSVKVGENKANTIIHGECVSGKSEVKLSNYRAVFSDV